MTRAEAFARRRSSATRRPRGCDPALAQTGEGKIARWPVLGPRLLAEPELSPLLSADFPGLSTRSGAVWRRLAELVPSLAVAVLLAWRPVLLSWNTLQASRVAASAATAPCSSVDPCYLSIALTCPPLTMRMQLYVLNDRKLFIVGWFGVREKYYFSL